MEGLFGRFFRDWPFPRWFGEARMAAPAVDMLDKKEEVVNVAVPRPDVRQGVQELEEGQPVPLPGGVQAQDPPGGGCLYAAGGERDGEAIASHRPPSSHGPMTETVAWMI